MITSSQPLKLYLNKCNLLDKVQLKYEVSLSYNNY